MSTLQKFAKTGEGNQIACEQAPTAPLSPLPPAKWLGLLAVRFPGFPLSRFSVSGFPVSRFAGLPLSAFLSALCAACLLALIAFNHPQGLGIAGLGLLAVIIWRLIEWKRSMVFWLAAAAIALSVAAILWWPRNPALDAAYRPAGWLTAWYGFNLFSPSSLAFDRAMAILGFLGIVNLLTSFFLLRRNHVVAWLTITPLLALSLPVVAIPFAGVLARRGLDDVLIFHRMLLAIPAGLALVVLGAQIAKDKFQVPGIKFQESSTGILQEENGEAATTPDLPGAPTAHGNVAWGQAHPALSLARRSVCFRYFLLSRFLLPAFPISQFAGLPRFRFPAFPFCLLSLAAMLVVPPNGPFYNRLWQALIVPSDDLMMKPVVLAAGSVAVRLRDVKHLRMATIPSVAYVLGAISAQNFPYTGRSIGQSVVEPLNSAIATALSSRPTFNHQCPMLTRDPSAADSLAWAALAGSPPQFVTAIRDFPASSTALQNPPGQCSDVFTADLIKVDPAKNYQVEFSARQLIGTNATAYLAIAWYDEGRRLLESNIPAPAGAGSPVDWDNGTYSYFGLVGESPPATWTIFRKSFGLGETAAIPRSAKFVRVGALLNYNSTPAATIQLTNVRLWQKSVSELAGEAAFRSDQLSIFIVPSSQMVWTSASQAAQTSHHWPAQEVAVDLAGGAELAAAARAASGMPVDPENAVFELGGKAPASNH